MTKMDNLVIQVTKELFYCGIKSWTLKGKDK